MFLNLAHTKLDVFIQSKLLLIQCYKLTAKFPAEEKFILCSQIRRASVSVLLNIAEGSSRKSSVERKRFYEVSRGSLIEIDTAFDAAAALEYVNTKDLQDAGAIMLKIFQMLSKMISQ